MKSPATRKSLAILSVLFVLILGFTACESTMERQSAGATAAEPVAKDSVTAQNAGAKTAERTEAQYDSVEFKKISLSDTEKAADTSVAIDRKIIRNADLTIEVPSTTKTQQRVVEIAKAYGGFVVTSEAKQRESAEPAQRTLDIKLVVRIPENQFDGALNEMRGLASNISEDKVTGQDVTEEFIDLEARIKTQKALEAQFLDIMKQAHKIADAMEVQRQIAEVRADIERLEGRKRFLENRSSLSTITVNILTPKPMVVVPTTGFRHSVGDAVSESIDVGSAIVLFFVRFVIVMIPIGVFVLLPAGLIVRYVMRRAKRMRMAEALSVTPSE